jgi:hypothetical protein
MLLNTSLTDNMKSSKALQALNSLMYQVTSGQLGNQADLISEIQSLWTSSVSGSPGITTTVPYMRAGELPMQDMISTPFEQISNDISFLWDQLEAVRGALSDFYNSAQTSISGVSSLLNQVQNQSVLYQLFVSDTSPSFLWASDCFTSLDHVNSNLTTAFVDTINGLLSLEVLSETSLVPSISNVSISLANSWGIPGNNMEVLSETPPSSPDASAPETTVTLVDPNGTRANIGNIFDGNPNTWFEWEVNYIPRIQPCELIGTEYHTDPSAPSVDVLKVTKDNTNKEAGWSRYIKWPGDSTYDMGPNNNGYPIAIFTDANGNIAYGATQASDTSLMDTSAPPGSNSVSVAPSPATLSMSIRLAEPSTVSMITISPMILGGTYPIVSSLSVGNSTMSSNMKTIASNVYLDSKLNESLNAQAVGVPQANYSGVGVFTLNNETLDTINITLQANGTYTPVIGLAHPYYFEIVHKSSSFGFFGISIGLGSSTNTLRLPNPQLAINTGSHNQNLSGIGELAGLIGGGTVGGLIGDIAGSLIGISSSTNVVRSGNATDVFSGSRSVIGISDIGVAARSYANQSVLVSTPWVFPVPIKAVALIVTEDVPAGWNSTQSWITYEISTDGVVWNPILPQNLNSSSDSMVTVSGSQIIVRITLSSPSGITSSTPIVTSYAIKALPA